MKWTVAGLCLLVTAFAKTDPNASDTGVSRSLDKPCSAVQSVAVAYLKGRGFDVAQATSCTACRAFHLTGHRVRTRDGQRVSERAVLRNYVVDDRVKSDDLGRGWWTRYRGQLRDGNLRLDGSAQGCVATLSYRFLGYGAMFWVLLPVDGESVSYRSSGILESDHLNGIADAVASH